MNKTLFARMVLAAALGPLASMPAVAQAKTIVITITSFKFVPDKIAAAPGDTLLLVNKDLVPHTVTATNKSWDTGSVAAGSSVSMVLPEKPEADFICKFHPMMKGVLRLAPKSP